jgi:hypothetical protein
MNNLLKTKLRIMLECIQKDKINTALKISNMKKLFYCRKCQKLIINNPIRNSYDYTIYCIKCYEKTDPLASVNDLFKCYVCGLIHDNDINYECGDCKHSICSDTCIKITGAQTRECVCKKCFDSKYIDGKCITCNKNNILFADIYLWDDGVTPYCEHCT